MEVLLHAVLAPLVAVYKHVAHECMFSFLSCTVTPGGVSLKHSAGGVVSMQFYFMMAKQMVQVLGS